MKIVFLRFGDLSSDPRIEHEAQTLVKAGHEVFVLALRNAKFSQQESRDGYVIQRIADFTTARTYRVIKKWKQLRARRQAFLVALDELSPNVIHACDADTLSIAALAAKKLGIPYLYDAFELYSDMLMTHSFSHLWPVQAYWKHIERTYIPHAQIVLTVSPQLASVLSKRYGVSPQVLYNVPYLMPLESSSRLRNELFLPSDAIIVLYQGVLIQGRDLDLVIRSCVGLPPDVHMVIQGFGTEEERLKTIVHELNLDNRVHFFGYVPGDQLHEYACGADIGILSYDTSSLNNKMAAPNKLFAYMMAALPIVGSRMPFLESMIEGEGLGRCFMPGDENSLRQVLYTMTDLVRKDRSGESTEVEGMKTRARVLAETRYNWQQQESVLLDIYNS